MINYSLSIWISKHICHLAALVDTQSKTQTQKKDKHFKEKVTRHDFLRQPCKGVRGRRAARAKQVAMNRVKRIA